MFLMVYICRVFSSPSKSQKIVESAYSSFLLKSAISLLTDFCEISTASAISCWVWCITAGYSRHPRNCRKCRHLRFRHLRQFLRFALSRIRETYPPHPRSLAGCGVYLPCILVTLEIAENGEICVLVIFAEIGNFVVYDFYWHIHRIRDLLLVSVGHDGMTPLPIYPVCTRVTRIDG